MRRVRRRSVPEIGFIVPEGRLRTRRVVVRRGRRCAVHSVRRNELRVRGNGVRAAEVVHIVRDSWMHPEELGRVSPQAGREVSAPSPARRMLAAQRGSLGSPVAPPRTRAAR